jgi:glycosyltransferase involved in cell wall biosynthesis
MGALSAEKNPVAGVEAMASLAEAQLVVAGGGPLADECVERGRQMAPGRVHLLGPVDDPTAVLAAADLLLLPSHTEGIPAVAIEAMLAGLPVVASRVGGIPEAVVHGETGLLLDDPTPFRLARAVEQALRDADVVADAWSDLLAAVVEGRSDLSGPGLSDPGVGDR